MYGPLYTTGDRAFKSHLQTNLKWTQTRGKEESFSVPYNPFLLIVRCSDAANKGVKIIFAYAKNDILHAFDGAVWVFNPGKLDDLDYTRYKEEMNIP